MDHSITGSQRHILALRKSWIACSLLATIALPASAADKSCSSNWALWETWASRYVQQDGRMLSSSTETNHSSSEGQSYGLFLALLANDRVRFERMWKWTTDNMQGGDPARLPGWLWGQGKDGKWQIQDGNSASDADLWIVYSLLEASRLWGRPDYHDAAMQLLGTLENNLIVNLPGFGKMVLPGPEGFALPKNLWRLNPSYLPIPLLRRFAKESSTGHWKEIADNTTKMIRETSPKGYAADWIAYQGLSTKTGTFTSDPVNKDIGSYDAIRVYLWAGLTSKRDTTSAPLLAALDGMARQTLSNISVPEKVKTTSGTSSGKAPFGFYAAIAPFLMAKGQTKLAGQFQDYAESEMTKALSQDSQRAELLYYNVMLTLFSAGWKEQRYHFRPDGTLKLSWEKSCARATPR